MHIETFYDILLLSLFIFQQEMLNISKKSAPCFVNFSRLQQITDMQAEINQVIMLNFMLPTSSIGKILIGSNSSSLALSTLSST